MNKVHFGALLNIENILNTSMRLYIIPHMFKNESNTLRQQLIMIFILTYLFVSQMHNEWFKWLIYYQII